MVMSWIFTGLLALSVVCAMVLGNGGALAAACATGAQSGITLAISIAGSLCLWTGVGKLMETLCDCMDSSPPGSSVHGDSPGKNTGVGCHALPQGIFPTQGLTPGLLHCRQILYHLRTQAQEYWSG